MQKYFGVATAKFDNKEYDMLMRKIKIEEKGAQIRLKLRQSEINGKHNKLRQQIDDLPEF